MENIDNAVIDNTVASQHPVLKQLKDQIASLEAEVQKFKDEAFKEAQLRREQLVAKLNYQEKVRNVVIEALENYDEETVKWIAKKLDIELTKTKTIEVNVTFNIDIEYEIGEEPDPEWDFEFDVRHDSISDYTTDVVYTKES